MSDLLELKFAGGGIHTKTKKKKKKAREGKSRR